MINHDNELLLSFMPQVNAGELVAVLNPRGIGIVDGFTFIPGTTLNGARVRVPLVLEEFAPDEPAYDSSNGVCYMAPALR